MEERPFILKGKICLNEECIIGKVALNRNVEDKHQYIQILDDQNMKLFEHGYRAYIFQSKPNLAEKNSINYCYDIKDYETIKDFDVLEITNNLYIKVLYRDDSDDNAIVVTNQCNSNCIMCPDSDIVRKCSYNVSIEKLIEQVRCMPNDTRYLTITGGEPGMLKSDLNLLMNECKEHFTDTEFLLLSNGRVFSNTWYVDEFVRSIPSNIRVGIPIYADNEEEHDGITRAKNSFKQTVSGIKKLLERKVGIEIRIVVLKKNYMILEDIARFIIKEMPSIKMVNIMALEMLGNSYKNKDEVWVSFDEVKRYLYNACTILIKAGIITNLYNFPLCNLDERLYSLAHKSITDYKVRYREECENCKAKEICGGFFFSTINVKNIKVKPIK